MNFSTLCLKQFDWFSKESLKKFMKVSFTIILIIIFISAYWTKVWTKYQNKATAFTTKRVFLKDGSREWPAVTFCIENAFKSSILRANANTARRHIFRGNIEKNKIMDLNNLNISLHELFYKAAYKLDQDFSLEFFNDPDASDHLVNVKLGQNPGIVQVEEFPTKENGLCYSLFNFDTFFNTHRIAFGIIPLNQSEILEDDKPTGVSLYLTSKNTRHNIIMESWPYVEPFTFQKKFGFRSMVWMKLHQINWKFYEGNPNCNSGCTPKDCLNESILLSNNCTTTKKCIPIILKNYFINSSLNLCNRNEENSCMYGTFSKYFQNSEDFEKCERPQSDIQYTAYMKDGQYLNMPNPTNALFISLAHTSKHETIKEEIRIYDTASLIGSLGGTLGLFVGFSFLGVLNYILDRLFAML